ncbi:MAG: ferredoxin family protein [Firmicutes bacterium]|nr:ferredoxin family protein [Bacillota bacterium]
MERLVIDEERCKGCELCLNFCPRGLLRLADRLNGQGFKPAEISDQARCTSCALCARMCPETAIAVYREEKGGA